MGGWGVGVHTEAYITKFHMAGGESRTHTAPWMDQRYRQRQAMLRTLRLEDLCSTVRLVDCRGRVEEQGRGPGLGQRPGEERGEGERQWNGRTRDLRAERLYWAVLTGDAKALRTLLKRNYVDVDVLFEIGHEELEWRSSQANIGHSGKAQNVFS